MTTVTTWNSMSKLEHRSASPVTIIQNYWTGLRAASIDCAPFVSNGLVSTLNTILYMLMFVVKCTAAHRIGRWCEITEVQPYLIHTVCNHLFHRQCLLTWMGDTDHDDCPTCRHTPLYEIKRYQALLAMEYPNLHNTAAITTTTPESLVVLTPEQQREQALTLARQKWHFLIYWFFLVLVLVTLICRFISTSQP
jgi:Anaphase-promoting complex subunit 11 RING-H2 finger